MKRGDDGAWRPNYDPRLADVYRAALPDKDVELWPLYDAIRCPTMSIRGEQSDLLSRQTWSQMGQRGPKAKLVSIPGVGHAPTLMQPDQIALVRDFLTQGEG